MHRDDRPISPNLRFDLIALSASLLLALAFRLPGLTVFLTADEPRSWFGRSIIFLEALSRGDWANTAPGATVSFIENVSLSPAPGVTTMWTGALGIILEYWRRGMPGSLVQFLRQMPFDPLEPAMLFSLRLPGVLISALAVGLTYWWSRPLLGRRGALLAAALIALDPFYLALSRVLGHDGLVATFMWLSLLAFLRTISLQPDNKSAQLAVAGDEGVNHDNAGNTQHVTANPLPQTGRRMHVSRFPLPASHLSYLLLSGAFAGLAFLSKYPALFIGAFIALAMLIIYLWRAWFSDNPHPSSPRSSLLPDRTSHIPHPTSHIPHPTSRLKPALMLWLRDMALWSAAAALVFVLFWPAMWVNPVGPVMVIINDALRASASSHQKGSFFLGQAVDDPGALFYPLVALLRITPVVLVGLLLSLWLPWRRMANWRSRASRSEPPGKNDPIRNTQYVTLFVLLAYILLYTLLVTYGGKKQDRYLLPIFPAISMLATMGYMYVFRFSSQPPPETSPASSLTLHASRSPLSAPPSPLRPLRSSLPASRSSLSALRSSFLAARLKSLLPALILLLQVIFVLPAYPYYFSYYNSFFQGGAMVTDTILVGWGEGLNEAAAYLNTLPGAETAKVVSWYSTTFEPYFKGQTIYKIDEEKISRSAKPGLAADYVVFYVNQLQRQLPSPGALQFFRVSGSPLYTVTLQGIDYAWVYPSVGMQHVFKGEVRLVGQAELLGYNLTDEAGRPVTTMYPESVVFLALYWEWQGKAEAEPIQISLVDAEGKTRGWGNPIQTVAPLPYAEWQEGMIVRDDFALVILADTLPGEYRLAAWIDRPATGETVGVFPLDEEPPFRVVPRPAE